MSPGAPRSGFKSTLLALSVLACTAWANSHGHVKRHHQPQAASVKPRTTPTSFNYAAWTEWAGSPARPTDAPKLHVHRHAMHVRRGEGECGCENCCEEDGQDDKDKDKDKDKEKQKTETVTVTADINENTVEPKKKGANLRDAIKSCGRREFAYVRIRLHCSMKKGEERNLDIHHCGEADEWQDLWLQWHSEKVARGVSAGALTKCQTFIIQPRVSVSRRKAW